MHQRLIMFLVHNRGKVKLMYHPFPLKNLEGHEDSEYAAMLSEQLDGDDFWNFVNKVYALEEKPTRADLDRIFATFKNKHPRTPKEAEDAVAADIKLGKEYGVQFTPTYLIFIDSKPESVASSNNIRDVIKEPKYAAIFAPPAKQGKAKK
jgi:protein-disulfide isomerase